MGQTDAHSCNAKLSVLQLKQGFPYSLFTAASHTENMTLSRLCPSELYFDKCMFEPTPLAGCACGRVHASVWRMLKFLHVVYSMISTYDGFIDALMWVFEADSNI